MLSVFDLLVLSQIPNVGLNRLRLLTAEFDSFSGIAGASVRDIAAIGGFGKKLATQTAYFFRNAKFDAARRHAEQQLSCLNKIEGTIITFWDRSYPEILKKIYDPPILLFARGTIDRRDNYSLAIVGTRTPSEYGSAMSERFSREFSRLGITVVSGLARGVDTRAHQAALKAGGRTLAVIGSGIDVIYPPENKSLAGRIAENGAVVSEYEMGAKPDAMNFPRRNRIISGLSLGTLIIETDLGGGAMITATTALDQDREVFAIPGMITARRSRGCNALIKDGRAKLVESLDDILVELSTKLKPLIKSSPQEEGHARPELTPAERKVLNVFGDSPLHIDAIAELAEFSISDTLVTLLSLEFHGEIRQLPGKIFSRT